MTKSADAFRTISEVADWLGVQPHVLRFWESKFTQVKPVKRAGGRRYYRPGDMALLGGIRQLLHEDGLTIKGVQKIIREEGVAHVADLSPPLDEQLDQIALDTPSEEVSVTDPAQPDMFAPPESAPFENVAQPPRAVPEAHVSEPPAAQEAPETSVPDTPAPVASAPDAPVPDAPVPDAPMAEDVPSEPATVTALPGFMTARSQTEPEAADTAEPSAPPAPDRAEPPTPQASDSSETEPAGDLPRFLQTSVTESDAATEAPPADVTPADADPAEPQKEAAAPASETAHAKPLIVEAPDPDAASFAVAPAALTAALRTVRLSPAQRRTVAPLVARLAAHRDRLASDAAPTDTP